MTTALGGSGDNSFRRALHRAGWLAIRLLGLLSVAAVLGACSLLPRSLSDRIAPADMPVSGLRLDVQAPRELQALLETHLDLARLHQLRGDEVIDDEEWARLAAWRARTGYRKYERHFTVVTLQCTCKFIPSTIVVLIM